MTAALADIAQSDGTFAIVALDQRNTCLLYTSDAADE